MTDICQEPIHLDLRDSSLLELLRNLLLIARQELLLFDIITVSEVKISNNLTSQVQGAHHANINTYISHVKAV